MKNKITKKQIKETLRSLDSTKIFRLGALLGMDLKDGKGRHELYEFVLKNAPTQKVSKKAYRLVYGAGDYKHFRCYRKEFTPSKISPLTRAIRFAKQQKREGINKSNYFKILIEGFRNIYWASPTYKHSDYNKSIAFPNTEENRLVMQKINKFLLKD